MADGAPPSAGEPRGALAHLARAIGWLNALAVGLSAAGILASLGLISWAVVMRYVFNRPPVWTDEVVGFMLVGIVMLAAAQSLRRGEHIGVDILVARLGPRGRFWAQLWSSVSVLVVAVILIVNGWRTAMFSRQLGILTEGNLEIPVYWLQLFLPLGGLLMLLVSLEALVRLVAGAPSLAAPPRRGEEAD
ncbi:MAG: TRAP transporter small permease [Burkholderiales bacterium]|nr:TRAP transporter small permease [Burkholderiales bacterium]